MLRNQSHASSQLLCDTDWGAQVAIRDSVLKAVADTDSISYVHVTCTINSVVNGIPDHADSLSEQSSRQQPHKKVLRQNSEAVDNRPEDVLEIEVQSMWFVYLGKRSSYSFLF